MQTLLFIINILFFFILFFLFVLEFDHKARFVNLLFLTVRIGAMLAYTPLDEKSLALLLSYLQDFLK